MWVPTKQAGELCAKTAKLRILQFTKLKRHAITHTDDFQIALSLVAGEADWPADANSKLSIARSSGEKIFQFAPTGACLSSMELPGRCKEGARRSAEGARKAHSDLNEGFAFLHSATLAKELRS
jgi:hypothetical protein